MAGEIRVHATILEEMLRRARLEPEIECCGLLAGRCGIITTIVPTANALASATAYEIAPQELFNFFRHIRTEGLQHLGHYHSHLRSENCPSATDIAQAFYPDQAYFIVSLMEGVLRPVRAFSIRDGVVQELEIVAVEP